MTFIPSQHEPWPRPAETGYTLSTSKDIPQTNRIEDLVKQNNNTLEEILNQLHAFYGKLKGKIPLTDSLEGRPDEPMGILNCIEEDLKYQQQLINELECLKEKFLENV